MAKSKNKKDAPQRTHAMRFLEENPHNDVFLAKSVYETFGKVNLILTIVLILIICATTYVAIQLFFVTPKEIIAFQDGTLAGCIKSAEELQDAP